MCYVGKRERELLRTRSQVAEVDLELYAGQDDLDLISPLPTSLPLCAVITTSVCHHILHKVSCCYDAWTGFKRAGSYNSFHIGLFSFRNH